MSYVQYIWTKYSYLNTFLNLFAFSLLHTVVKINCYNWNPFNVCKHKLITIFHNQDGDFVLTGRTRMTAIKTVITNVILFLSLHISMQPNQFLASIKTIRCIYNVFDFNIEVDKIKFCTNVTNSIMHKL